MSGAGYAGWVEAGAAGMAMRPNSLWADYTGLPFVFSDQWIDDVVWCGQHRMSAADFDSLVGDYAAVGPSYYLLARTLFNPATANLSAIRAEYYSAYGPAAGEVESYIAYWQSWAQKTYTDPKVCGCVGVNLTESLNIHTFACVRFVADHGVCGWDDGRWRRRFERTKPKGPRRTSGTGGRSG